MYNVNIMAEPTRIVHQIWLGNEPPSETLALMDEVKQLYGAAGWTYRRWGDADVGEFPAIVPMVNKVKLMAVKADVLRLAVLRKYGGLYVDADFKCFKVIDEMLPQTGIAMVRMKHGHWTNALMYAAQPHEACFEMAVRQLIKDKKRHLRTDISISSGPKFITRLIRGMKRGVKPKITELPTPLVHPYMWYEIRNADYSTVEKTGAYMMHLFDGSWIDKNKSNIERQKRKAKRKERKR